MRMGVLSSGRREKPGTRMGEVKFIREFRNITLYIGIHGLVVKVLDYKSHEQQFETTSLVD
jgi:hypothetical protein